MTTNVPATLSQMYKAIRTFVKAATEKTCVMLYIERATLRKADTIAIMRRDTLFRPE